MQVWLLLPELTAETRDAQHLAPRPGTGDPIDRRCRPLLAADANQTLRVKVNDRDTLGALDTLGVVIVPRPESSPFHPIATRRAIEAWPASVDPWWPIPQALGEIMDLLPNPPTPDSWDAAPRCRRCARRSLRR